MGEIKFIQIAERPVMPGLPTVWAEHGPGVDIVMDLKALTFAPGSLDEIYAHHVLDHLFPAEGIAAIKNWLSCLKPGGRLIVVVDDFEYVARAFVGGDISAELFNELYNNPTQYTRESLSSMLHSNGFQEGKVVIWHENLPGRFNKKITELVFEGTK